MMRAVRAPIPIGFRNKSGRPLLLVVHASRGYDYKKSVSHPIQQTLAKAHPRFNILEIVDGHKGSYLSLPPHLRTDKEYAGSLLNRDFFHAHGELLKANTFVFAGGRANKCLLRTLLSILIAKLTPLEKLFAKQDSHPHIEGLLQNPLPQDKPLELDFHFNCEAIYPSHITLKRHSKNAEVLDWSPNLPWIVMKSMLYAHSRVFGKLGINAEFSVDGKKQGAARIINSESQVKINMHYWSSAGQMDGILMAA